MRPSDEMKRIWKLKLPGKPQCYFAEYLDISAPKLSEYINNKRQVPIKLIRRLVSLGCDANIMIKDNIG